MSPRSLTNFPHSCASSKHLQTRRFLSTLESYLIDVQKMILQIYRQANERPAPFVDHTGTLRDAKTGEPIMPVHGGEDDEDDKDEDLSK
jgi:carnitine O-acetyltransferase